MDIARLTGHFPEKRALIGIQPGYMSWGMAPTAAVQGSLDEAVDEAVKLIRQWQNIDEGNESLTAKYYDRNSVAVS